MALRMAFRAPRHNSSAGRAMHGQMISGLDEIVQNFRAFVGWIDWDVLPEVMVEALNPTLELSNYYAPKDTGELRGSSYAEVRKRRGGPMAEVGYGKGGQAPYAVFVHENPNFFHAPPTQAKFLQRAMDEDLPDIFQRIAMGLMTRARA
jgi:hypothetical protein